jgi:hypothetical protein
MIVVRVDEQPEGMDKPKWASTSTHSHWDWQMEKQSIVCDQDSDWVGVQVTEPRESRSAETVGQFEDMSIDPLGTVHHFHGLTKGRRILTVYVVLEQRQYRRLRNSGFAKLMRNRVGAYQAMKVMRMMSVGFGSEYRWRRVMKGR